MKKFIIVLLLVIPLYHSYSSNKYKQYLDTNYFKYFDLDKHSMLKFNYMQKAEFIDSMNGMICFRGKDIFYPLGKALYYPMGLYKTSDGGSTWSMDYPLFIKIIKDTTIIDYFFANNFFYIDKNTIITQSEENYYFNKLNGNVLSYLESNDGGESWQMNIFDICQGYDTSLVCKWSGSNISVDLLKNGYGIHPTKFGIYKTNNYFNNVSLIMNTKDIVKKLADDSIPCAMYHYKWGVIEDSACYGNSPSSQQYDIWGNDEQIKIFDNNNIICKVHLKDNKSDTTFAIFLRTTDEFKTFEYVISPFYNNAYIKPSFLEWNKIWDVGYYKNLSDSLWHLKAYYTLNFGKSWETKLDIPTNSYIEQNFSHQNIQVKFKNDSVGIVFSDYSRAYLTTDGGNTWKNLFKDFENTNTLNLTNAYFKDDDIILLCEYCDDIITYKIHPDTSVTSVQEFPQINTKQTIVCPNPVQDILTISNLPNDSDYNTTIEIYNIYGLKEIEIPYTDKIDVSKLNTGVYYLKINNQFTKFVKFVK